MADERARLARSTRESVRSTIDASREAIERARELRVEAERAVMISQRIRDRVRHQETPDPSPR